MVILLQLFIFLAAIIWRSRYLFGRQLKKLDSNSNYLRYISKGKKGKILKLHIGLLQKNSIPFIVRPERWYHRTLKKLGLASELKLTSDFDNYYFLTTDYPQQLELALNSGLMKDLELLFQYPVKELYVSPNKIWCILNEKAFSDPEEELSPYYEFLEKIAQQVSGHISNRKLVTHRITALFSLCLHAGLLTLGILGFFAIFINNVEIVDISEWMLKSFITGGIAAALWFFIIINFFRRTSWICWVLVDFILAGIAGFLLSSLFVIRDLNISLPQAAPTTYYQPIVQKTCSLECRKKRRRGSQSHSYSLSNEQCAMQYRSAVIAQYQENDPVCFSGSYFFFYLDIKRWDKLDNYNFSVGEYQFDHSQIGDKVSVKVYPGALGLQWLDNKELKTIYQSTN